MTTVARAFASGGKDPCGIGADFVSLNSHRWCSTGRRSLEVLIDKLVDLIIRVNTRPGTPSVFERPLFERAARNPYLRKVDATLLVWDLCTRCATKG